MTSEQGMLAGMPTRLYSCTPARLTAWTDCQRRYRFTYLDRPSPARGKPWAHLSLGTAIHQALADVLALPVGDRSPAAGATAVARRWRPEGFASDQQADRARVAASGWVSSYLGSIDLSQEPLGIERTVALRTQRLALSGRTDRIDARTAPDGSATLAVVDYKTGRRVPDDDEARTSLQLGIYALAAARTLRRPCTRVELHHLPSATVITADHTPESLQRKVDEAESIAREAAQADADYRDNPDPGARDDLFPAQASRRCAWCDFRAHCPDGRAAVPEAQSWDALPEEIS